MWGHKCHFIQIACGLYANSCVFFVWGLICCLILLSSCLLLSLSLLCGTSVWFPASLFLWCPFCICLVCHCCHSLCCLSVVVLSGSRLGCAAVFKRLFLGISGLFIAVLSPFFVLDLCVCFGRSLSPSALSYCVCEGIINVISVGSCVFLLWCDINLNRLFSK